MRVCQSTVLDCAPERAWRAVQHPRLLLVISRPLLHLTPILPLALPERWEERAYLVQMKLFGWLPLGNQWIDIAVTRIDATPGRQCYQIRDQGHGDLLTRWEHLITIEETPTGQTRYTDEVEIEAGLLTPLVWLAAQGFFWVRQRNWQRLVRHNFSDKQPASSLRQALRREYQVAFSRRTQPVWFRVAKWIFFIAATIRLARSRWLKVWLLGLSLGAMLLHLLYRWKTATWTRAWGGWDDLDAGQVAD